MKFLCLAYGGGRHAGTGALQMLAAVQDRSMPALLRRSNAPFAAHEVGPEVLTVSTWDGEIAVQEQAMARHPLPLTGFAVVDAASLSEVLSLAASTSCARAGGFVEVRALLEDPEPEAWLDTTRGPGSTSSPESGFARTERRNRLPRRSGGSSPPLCQQRGSGVPANADLVLVPVSEVKVSPMQAMGQAWPPSPKVTLLLFSCTSWLSCSIPTPREACGTHAHGQPDLTAGACAAGTLSRQGCGPYGGQVAPWRR
jgi:hypothetical protein